MIDCGFSLRETRKRLATLELSVDDISGILVTHEHSDHMKGVAALSAESGITTYMTAGTYRSGKFPTGLAVKIINCHQPFAVGDIDVTPVAVPHDAREPVQYVFQHQQLKLGVLTDLGSITPHILEQYAHCDGLLVEANYDTMMLRNGKYPPALKSRVGGRWGHLSNDQTVSLLRRICCARLQQLVIGHISENNNTPEQARATIESNFSTAAKTHYAAQSNGIGWCELHT